MYVIVCTYGCQCQCHWIRYKRNTNDKRRSNFNRNTMEQYYLELCNDPIRFDPISQINEVFFDDSNKQVRSFNRFIDDNSDLIENLMSFSTLSFRLDYSSLQCVPEAQRGSLLKVSPKMIRSHFVWKVKVQWVR